MPSRRLPPAAGRDKEKCRKRGKKQKICELVLFDSINPGRRTLRQHWSCSGAFANCPSVCLLCVINLPIAPLAGTVLPPAYLPGSSLALGSSHLSCIEQCTGPSALSPDLAAPRTTHSLAFQLRLPSLSTPPESLFPLSVRFSRT